jgi:hypothetical protein
VNLRVFQRESAEIQNEPFMGSDLYLKALFCLESTCDQSASLQIELVYAKIRTIDQLSQRMRHEQFTIEGYCRSRD